MLVVAYVSKQNTTNPSVRQENLSTTLSDLTALMMNSTLEFFRTYLTRCNMWPTASSPSVCLSVCLPVVLTFPLSAAVIYHAAWRARREHQHQLFPRWFKCLLSNPTAAVSSAIQGAGTTALVSTCLLTYNTWALPFASDSNNIVIMLLFCCKAETVSHVAYQPQPQPV